MAKYKKNDISEEIQNEALACAKKTQKPGQTKEQTRLIALGIQKGIAEYKKSEKSKMRQADKAKKKSQNIRSETQNEINLNPEKQKQSKLAWFLLGLSWVSFLIYLFLSSSTR